MHTVLTLHNRPGVETAARPLQTQPPPQLVLYAHWGPLLHFTHCRQSLT